MSGDLYKGTLISLYDTADGSWSNVPNADGFCEFISPLDGGKITTTNTELFQKPLPFYKNTNLILVKTFAHGNEDGDFYFFIQSESEYVQLRGDARSIHEFNDDFGLFLNDENVFDYIKFLYAFAWNDEGLATWIIEGANSEYVKDLSPYESSRYTRKYDGAYVSETQSLEKYTIQTRALVGQDLFDLTLELSVDGYCDVVKDKFVGVI